MVGSTRNQEEKFMVPGLQKLVGKRKTGSTFFFWCSPNLLQGSREFFFFLFSLSSHRLYIPFYIFVPLLALEYDYSGTPLNFLLTHTRIFF